MIRWLDEGADVIFCSVRDRQFRGGDGDRHQRFIASFQLISSISVDQIPPPALLRLEKAIVLEVNI